jgi:hypothetical protein
MSPQTESIVTKLIMLGVGLFLLVPFSYKLYQYGAFRHDAISAVGVITLPARGMGMGGRPFVEYRDATGTVHELKSIAKTHWFFAPEKGETLRVLFQKDNPDTAIVDSVFHYILLPLFCSALGIRILYGVFRRNPIS